MNEKEHTYMIGNLRIQVSDMRKALDVIQRHKVNVKFSTKSNIIEFNLRDSIFITIDSVNLDSSGIKTSLCTSRTFIEQPSE